MVLGTEPMTCALIEIPSPCFLKIFFDIGSHRVAQVGLKFVIFLPQPLLGWDYRCSPLHEACVKYYKENTRSFGCNSVIEHLSSMCEAQGLIPSTNEKYINNK